MEVVLAISLAIFGWAVVFAFTERLRVASRERVEMAQLADKRVTDDQEMRIKKLEKHLAEHEFSLNKLTNQLEIVRAQSQKPARPITGLRG